MDYVVNEEELSKFLEQLKISGNTDRWARNFLRTKQPVELVAESTVDFDNYDEGRAYFLDLDDNELESKIDNLLSNPDRNEKLGTKYKIYIAKE